jgi:hypothetical protein
MSAKSVGADQTSRVGKWWSIPQAIVWIVGRDLALAKRRQGVASTLGAPVDAAAWGINRLGLKGLNVPGGFVDGLSAGGSPQHWVPAPTVPLSSGFFNNLLGDAGSVSAEAWRRLRR